MDRFFKVIYRKHSLKTEQKNESTNHLIDDYVDFSYQVHDNNDFNKHELQTLAFDNNQYWIVFCGKIYNHQSLLTQLREENYSFTTETDAELVIATYKKFKKNCVNKLRGMFSFVIWDRKNKQLFAARDRFGIKPLYFTENDEQICFSSEKKSLESFHSLELDEQALQHYFTYQYVPEPLSLNKKVQSVPAGSFISLLADQQMELEHYFIPEFIPTRKADEDVSKLILDTLRSSVHLHIQGDEPIGASLSGGIDSTAIVALAKEIKPDIPTFTVGFESEGFSEISVAQETAEKLNVKNTSFTITPEDFIQELPNIIWHMGDPVADPASIPLYFVNRKASEHVKVILSGEGSDELFGGYRIYHEPLSLEFFNNIPKKFKSLLLSLSQLMPDGLKGKSFIERGCLPLEQRYIGNAKHFSEEEKSQLLNSYNKNFHHLLITDPLYRQVTNYDAVSKMQFIDLHTWLRGDILVKANQMAEAHSIEVRTPFLDKEVFEVATSLHLNHKVNKETTKVALREALKTLVPEHVQYRPKLGFPVPIRHWLKHELHDWAKELLTFENAGGRINTRYVLGLFDEHCTGKKDNSRRLWTVLTFLLWYQIFVEKKQFEQINMLIV